MEPEDRELGTTHRGWQHEANMRVEGEFRKVLFVRTSNQTRALVRSQASPRAGAALTVSRPRGKRQSRPRVVALRRVRQVLPLSALSCRCDRPLDPCGHHRAACAQAGCVDRDWTESACETSATQSAPNNCGTAFVPLGRIQSSSSQLGGTHTEQPILLAVRREIKVSSLSFLFFSDEMVDDSRKCDRTENREPDSQQVRQVATSGYSVRSRGGVAVATSGTTIQQRHGEPPVLPSLACTASQVARHTPRFGPCQLADE